MELRIDKEKNMANIKLSGILTKQVVLDALDATIGDKNYQSGMARLWDFRDADPSSMDSATIAELARYSMSLSQSNEDVKLALVVDSDLVYGLARMFEAYSADAKSKIGIFRDIEEAENWIAE